MSRRLAPAVLLIVASALGAKNEKQCKACLHLVNALQTVTILDLLKKEEAERAKEAKSTQRYKKTLRSGAIDELIEEAVSHNACVVLTTMNGAGGRVKKDCEALIDDHSDELSSALSSWHHRNVSNNELYFDLCVRGARVCKTDQLSLVARHAPRMTGRLSTILRSRRSCLARRMMGQSSKWLARLWWRR